MCKFAFYFAACMALFVAQSFAQPRDLFAEFESEVKAEAPQEMANSSSSSVSQSSSSIVLSSSSAIVSSSSIALSSSSVVVSSSSVAQSSSSISSSSVALSSSSIILSSSSAIVSSSSFAEQVAKKDSIATLPVADSLKNSSSSVAIDSLTSSSSIDSLKVDSLNTDSLNADSLGAATDSIAVDTLQSSSSAIVIVEQSSSSINRRDLLGPVKMSKVNSIDEMKGRYKSPRKALFMSLVVPGSGQMYVGGSNFTYIRGGVYLALEAALWGSWYYFSVHKYDKQVDRYKKFAKTHYSIGRYESAMRDLYNADAVNYESEFRVRYLGSRESFCEGIFGKASMHGCYDRDKLYHNDVEYKNDFVNSTKKLGDEMDKVKFDSPSEVYQLVADKNYVLGWDDVDNAPVATSLDLEDPNSLTVDLGTSKNMKEYRSMRSKANDYADMQAWFFGGLILNHIISAIDAAFTANAHNKALYEEKLSWYDHLHFDSGVSLFDGFGINVQASWGF